MEHANKLVLVDRRLEELKEKESFEHEQPLEKKHSRPAEMKVSSASYLEIERIWSDNTISDYQKLKMYSAAWNRYLSATKSFKMPWFAPVLEQLFKMGKTAVFTPPLDADRQSKPRHFDTFSSTQISIQCRRIHFHFLVITNRVIAQYTFNF